MASISSIPSLSSSSAHFSVMKFPSDGHHHLPSRVSFRPLSVSAACATSTAERTFSRGIASPGSSLYEVLGIQNGASFGEIKSAYRKLARVLHPDVAAEGQKENRAYEFMKIRDAYETLRSGETIGVRSVTVPGIASAGEFCFSVYVVGDCCYGGELCCFWIFPVSEEEMGNRSVLVDEIWGKNLKKIINSRIEIN